MNTASILFTFLTSLSLNSKKIQSPPTHTHTLEYIALVLSRIQFSPACMNIPPADHQWQRLSLPCRNLLVESACLAGPCSTPQNLDWVQYCQTAPWHTGWPNSHGTGILCTFTGHQAQHHQGRAGNSTDRFQSPWHQGPRQATVPDFSILSDENQDSFYQKKKKSIKRELFLCLTNLSQENTSTPPPLPLSVDIIQFLKDILQTFLLSL